MKKKYQDESIISRCNFCEYAELLPSDESHIFCHRLSKEMNAENTCPAFSYDLLKRQPLRLRVTSHLTPGLLDDDED